MSFSFPIQFKKRNGEYDFISGTVNFTGNTAVVVAGCYCVATIAQPVFATLGFSQASHAAMAISGTIEVIGIGATVVGGVIALAICAGAAKGMKRL